jgi:hypothetical protein
VVTGTVMPFRPRGHRVQEVVQLNSKCLCAMNGTKIRSSEVMTPGLPVEFPKCPDSRFELESFSGVICQESYPRSADQVFVFEPLC